MDLANAGCRDFKDLSAMKINPSKHALELSVIGQVQHQDKYVQCRFLHLQLHAVSLHCARKQTIMITMLLRSAPSSILMALDVFWFCLYKGCFRESWARQPPDWPPHKVRLSPWTLTLSSLPSLRLEVNYIVHDSPTSSKSLHGSSVWVLGLSNYTSFRGNKFYAV